MTHPGIFAKGDRVTYELRGKPVVGVIYRVAGIWAVVRFPRGTTLRLDTGLLRHVREETGP